MRKIIYVSASQLHDWQDCERKWWFTRYYRALVEDWKLGFGGAIHEACYTFLLGKVYGVKADPIRAFDKVFDQRLGRNTVWPDKQDRKSVQAMGRRMIREFVAKWEKSNFQVVMHHGKPLLEAYNRLSLDHDVVLVGKADVIAWSPDHGTFPLDFKTAAQFTQEWFARVAPQLSAYVLLFESLLGRRMDSVGFFEMKKNKVKSTEPHLSIVPRHSEAQLDHVKEQIYWMAEDIRRGRFPARVRMAWNSPCSQCDFQAACHDGNFSALRKKKPFLKKAA